MGMDGVGDLEAFQWIAKILAMGLGVFFAVCFVAGMAAGPDKIQASTIIPEEIELGYIKPIQSTATRVTKDQDSEVQRLKLEIEKLKLANKLEKSKHKTYSGTGWDSVDIAGNTGNDWNPPEYYEMYAPELIKTKKPKTKKAKAKKSKPKKVEASDLIQECISALVGLGEKKSVARSMTNKYFLNNPNTKTVEQFIGEVYLK